MTRNDDRLLYDPLSDYKGRKKILDMHERLRIANSCENAVFLSVHMNSFPQEKYCGLQVYYSRNSIDSMRFAESVQGTVSKYLQPQNERKIKQGKDIFLLDRLKMPAILVECGFLSNKDECSLLSTEEYRDKLAFWIFYSIMCEIN
jgi:N-acetylmuramoyl-L-alanine amidase